MTNEENQTKEEINPASNQSPPAKDSKTPVILGIIGILGICCIGIAILFFIGPFAPDENDVKVVNIDGYDFNIPPGYKEVSTSGKKYREFKNGDDKILRIQNSQNYDPPFVYVIIVSQELDIEGTPVTINGKEAYKFNTSNTDGGGEQMYTYLISLPNDKNIPYNYYISITRNTPNPDEFVEKLL